MRNWIGTLLFVAGIVGIAGCFAFYRFGQARDQQDSTFKTARLQRSDLLVTISATGTLEPEEVVDVGAQVAGKIQELGTEPGTGKTIDFRSEVEPDTILARIDPALYDHEVNIAKAQLAKAEARLSQTRAQTAEADAAVLRAEADLIQYRVKRTQAERDFRRAERLAQTKSVTQEQLEAAELAYEVAGATYDVGEAALAQAKSAVATAKATEAEAEADVQSADASLKRAEQNLDYTTIRSPIKGVIIDRRVNIGQTVVSSLNAPSLFLIAKDLSRLQVWASVNEADIGRLANGQHVTFTIDTFPGEVFNGTVQQIRLNASMTQNVVTYTVVVDADNPENKLFPYLTANVRFEVARLTDVWVVPNSALRWKPRPEQIAPEFRDEKISKSVVWLRRGEFVQPIAVAAQDSDGTVTAVSSNELNDGLEVVIGEVVPEAKDDVVNPLLPKMRGTKKS